MPFQSKPTNVSMMNKSQVDRLNEYHSKTRGDWAGKQGKMAALDWLMEKTEPLQYEMR
ncbi:xaa-Pro aminopeptidase 1-like [Acropora palmata]|uniref:xaa-Pro aminopeptidase 1-like n=1 Tax=Acropora palmata TaxID=6131 RepID=UPI003D9FC470